MACAVWVGVLDAAAPCLGDVRDGDRLRRQADALRDVHRLTQLRVLQTL